MSDEREWERRGIVIDEFYPADIGIVWICDQCEESFPVTAQFETGVLDEDGKVGFVTICPDCLQAALDGINDSLENPKGLP